MPDNRIDDSRLWAYVHGQLGESERRDLDDLAAADKALARRMADIHALDRRLRVLVPLAAKPAEALEQAVLRSWEREQPMRGVRRESKIVVFFSDLQSAVSEWATWQSGLRLAVPVAAALLVMVGGINYMQSGLGYGGASVQPGVTYRGGEAAEPRYSEDELKACAVRVQEAARQAYDRQALRSFWNRVLGRQRWEMNLAAQELPGGRIRFTAKTTRGEQTAEWTGIANGADDVARRASAWGEEIVRGLAEPAAAK